MKIKVLNLAIMLVAIVGCSGGDDDKVAKGVPSCESIGIGPTDREVFTTPLLDTSKIQSSLVYGGMFPAGEEQAPNYEMGYRFNDGELEVPLRWPANVYVISLESSEYLTGDRAGVKDFSIGFLVCGGGDRLIKGQFAHITGLRGQMLELFEDEVDGASCEVSSGPSEDVRNCSERFNRAVEVTEGDLFAVAAGIDDGTGNPVDDYTPGLDLNLFDTAFEVDYVNRDRLGGESGMGYYFRYGVCVNEYFTDPYKTEALNKTGFGPGNFRVSAEHPCGQMAIDVEGTPAGVWIVESKSHLEMKDIDGFPSELLDSLLVLAPSQVTPDTHQEISTSYEDLSEVNIGGETQDWLISMPIETTNDTNIKFSEMVSGKIYCLRGEVVGHAGTFVNYFIEFSSSGGTNQVEFERLDSDCSGTSPGSRAFTAASYTFVR